MSQTPGLESQTPNATPPAGPANYSQPAYPQQQGYQQPPAYQPWNSARYGRRTERNAGLVIGLLLIFAGAFFLLRQFIPQLNLSLIWPVVVIGVGIVLIVAAFTRNRQ